MYLKWIDQIFRDLKIGKVCDPPEPSAQLVIKLRIRGRAVHFQFAPNLTKPFDCSRKPWKFFMKFSHNHKVLPETFCNRQV